MKLPADHPQRRELNDEVHARPPEPLSAPLGILYVAMLSGHAARTREFDHVTHLCRERGVEPPLASANHFAASFRGFRFKWERHTEFSRFQFFFDTDPSDPFMPASNSLLPLSWIEALPGELLVATRVAYVKGDEDPPNLEELADTYFAGNVLIGASVSGAAGTAATDFRIQADGFGRLLVIDHGMTPWQAGRIVQRLLEIETYRMMALLTLPFARSMGPFLSESGTELGHITTELAKPRIEDQPGLLERLLRLQAEIEARFTEGQFRFSAATAYYDLVQGRITELRETRIQGLQTFKEFTERRLAPAMSTCASVAERLNALSRRVTRSTQLLSTRLAIGREQQNQALLETMARRAKIQLRLQQTVEGLSVAAITYYIVGLIGYAAKALGAVGVPINPDVAMGVGIPLVAAVVAFGVRGIRRRMGLDQRRADSEVG